MAVIRDDEDLEPGTVVIGPDTNSENWMQDGRAKRIERQREAAAAAGVPFNEERILPGEHEE